MRITSKAIFVLSLTLAAVSARPAAAQAADTAGKPLRSELALDYSYLRSNAPPGGCTCFSLNGGSATYAWPVKPGGFAAVGDITIAHAGTISTSGLSLTLSTYSAGPRYTPRVGHRPVQPFAQVLLGLAHSSGSLVEGNTPGAANAAAAFAASFGGGLDLKATRRFSVRLAQVDYLLTAVDNGSNNHQNNLRISAGAVVHF